MEEISKKEETNMSEVRSKVAFLITSIAVDRPLDDTLKNETILVIALNKLLTLYRTGHDSCYTPGILDNIRNWHYGFHIPYKRLVKAYENRDEDTLKEVLFGGLCSEDIELFFDEAILGTRADGLQVGIKDLKYTTEWVSLPDITDKSSLRLKLELSGINSIIDSYDCGTVYCLGDGLNSLKVDDCCGIYTLRFNSLSLRNRNFKTLYVNAATIYNTNTEIENLVCTSLGAIKESKLHIHNAFFMGIARISNSEIKINNACNLLLDDLCKTKLEIDNGFCIAIENIIDSRLEFNCDLTAQLLDISKTRVCYNTYFIFNRKVNLYALVELIGQLIGEVNNNTFKIAITGDSYDYLKNWIDKRYMKYIVDMGGIK